MTPTIQTCIHHNSTSGTFLVVHHINQNIRYAFKYEHNHPPSANKDIAIYGKSLTSPEIVGWISHIVAHWKDSVDIIINSSLQYYSVYFHPKLYWLHISLAWIKLTLLQHFYHSIYISLHPSHHILHFENPNPLYFSFISVTNVKNASLDILVPKHLHIPIVLHR